MGTVKKKVEKEVSRVDENVSGAVDNVGNTVETGVKQVRNETARNLGTDGEKALRAGSDILIEKPMGRVGGAAKDISQGNIGDGARALALESTGLMVYKDAYDTGSEMLKKEVPNLPSIPVEAPVDTEAAEKALREDAAVQDQLSSSRKRGRASTVLTGPQGLSGSTAYSSKKTLLGA